MKADSFGSLRFMIVRRIERQRLELAKSEAQLEQIDKLGNDSKQVDLVKEASKK